MGKSFPSGEKLVVIDRTPEGVGPYLSRIQGWVELEGVRSAPV